MPLFHINPYAAKTGIFRENKVDTMAADAPATRVAWSSAANILAMGLLPDT